MKRICFYVFFILTIIPGCKQPQSPVHSFKSEDLLGIINNMTEVMIRDITNPPLASRFFAYACISGYEVVSQNDTTLPKLYTILNDYPQLHKPDTISGYSYEISALLAVLATAQKMQPSGKLLTQYEQKFLDFCREKGFSEYVIDQSKKYALAVSKQTLSYAKADGYNKISNFSRYTPDTKPGSWYPTPPAFMAAMEPYFNTVRPFLLDSCSQFKPPPPVPFSTDTNSAFYKLVMLNYKKTLSADEQQIAAFWDCNPFALQDRGHLMYGIKKISPGAHWMGIAGIACASANKNFKQSIQVFTLVAIGLMDGFICCWDEKFRSNRIRPETAIRKYIDSSWTPFLQTPPFPEYVSGHSTISATSATILTEFLGDNFNYTDSVEVSYGLPPRSFRSFNDAANEAAISRFYGGIHFMDAIDNGILQGEKVGHLVIQRLK